MPRPTFEEVEAAIQADDYTGFCVECGEEAHNVEPDARRYKCDHCGALEVYGAEEILISGFTREEPEPEPKPKPKPNAARALSLRQILTGEEQSERLRPTAAAIHTKHGIAIHNGIFVIDTGKADPDCIIDEEHQRRVDSLALQSKGFFQRETTCEIVPGELFHGAADNADKLYRRMMTAAYPHDPVCVVNEVFRKTCEKHAKGNFRRWLFSPHDHVNAILAVNTAGDKTAVLCCVDIE